MEEAIALVFILILLSLSLALYFLPAIIASYYKDKNTIWIFLLTLTTGWTSLGWILALLWAQEEDDIDLIEMIRKKL